MFSRSSFKPDLIASDVNWGKRHSWREKSTALFRSRGSSRKPRQSETGLIGETLRRYAARFVRHERSSAAAESTSSILPAEVTSEDEIQEGQRPQASDIAQQGENVEDNDDVPAESIVVSIRAAAGAADPQDLWSVAYREAVLSFTDQMKSEILVNGKAFELLTSLGETNKELRDDSLFRRGLQRLQGPLRNTKLALDLVRPVASIDPTASTALGVVSSVTAIAIAICGAEASFNDQIINMLEQVAVIDECDTLGQKLDPGNAIHKALVPVYRDLLNFYMTALDILTSKVFVLALVCNQLSQRLPTIVSDSIKHANLLRSRIGNATLELVTDIKKLLQEDKILKVLGVNKGKQRSQIHCKIRALKASAACKWILDDSKFLKWYDSQASERLIIFGGMGCGKTVITAHIVEELIHKNKNKIPRHLMCYHYCVDDETGQAVYIYASLILQLLDQQEGFKVEFDKWYDDIKKNKLRDPAQCSTDLANFFSKCVSTLDRELFIVIDGLNECDSISQHELVTMLEDVSKQTPRLKVFISSQCQERIEKVLHGTSQIRWNPSTERDMIIAQHTVERCLSGLCPDIQSLVTERLSQMAQGSAIWIKLIVELIQKRNIKAKGSMRAFLRDMPSSNELSQLYAKLFAQLTGDDPDNELLATNALEILAVARRPLSILELGWALALKNPNVNTQTMEELEDSVDAYRALGLLQPLLSQIDFEDIRGSQVRLVHQSLKVLILRDAPSTWPELRNFTETSRPDNPGVQQRQCKLESALLHACVKYLLLDEIDEMDLFSKEQEAARTLQALPGSGLFDDFSNESQQPDSSETNGSPEEGQRKTDQLYYNPSERGFGEFFIYASCFWLDHLKTSAPERLPDTSDLVKLCRAKSKRLHNWVGQNCRPDCTIMPKFDHDSELQDPLVLMSLYGPEIALKKLLRDHDVYGKDFLTDSVKQAIWQTISYGDLSRLEILFQDSRVRFAVRNMDFFRHLMGTWAQSSERDSTQWMDLFNLVISIFDTLGWNEDWGNEVLCVAVTFGCLPFIKKLFEKAATNPEMRQELLQDRRRDYHSLDHHQSVGEAAWYNHVDVLQYLLAQRGIEVHLRHRDSGGYNVLHKVARHSNPEVVSLLASRLPEGANQASNDGETPLSLIVFEAGLRPGRLACAEILLTTSGGIAETRRAQTTTTPTPSNDCWDEPLRIAARRGDLAMCRTLVEIGHADPRQLLRIDDHIDGTRQTASLKDPFESEERASAVLETLCSLAGIEL